MRERAKQWWISWLGPVLILSFLGVSIVSALVRHASFQTNLLDLGYYTQVIWNTAHGRWFVTSLKPPTFLGDHFSPILLLLAPLFWLAPDARTLLVIEAIALATAAFPAYLLLRTRYPVLAPIVVLAFSLNPLVHQTANHEFHEIMLAVPTLALSVYALVTRRDRLLWLGLALTLLIREDMAVYVASFGLYLVVCRADRRWQGVAVLMVSVVWLLALTEWIIPALGSGVYRHTGPFAQFGDSTREILLGVMQNPGRLLKPIVAACGNGTLLFLFLPVAGLAWLAPGEELLWIPGLLVLLMSDDLSVSRLLSWHAAPLIPLLWASVAVAVGRQRPRWATLSAGLLAALASVGYLLWSPFPGGGRFEPAAYEITHHAQVAHRILAQIPIDASVATQSKLGAHLGTRERLYQFPWFDQKAPPEMILLDENTREPYPLSASELDADIIQFQMLPEIETLWEQDGYYLFKVAPDRTKPRQGPWLWDSSLELGGYALAQTDGTGAFQSGIDSLDAGCILRVQLYWTALAQFATDCSISVRLVAPDGQLVAQDDSRPARGALNTLDWTVGRTIRDTHYLTVTPDSPPGELSLSVIVYDRATLQPLAPASGQLLTRLQVNHAAACKDTPVGTNH